MADPQQKARRSHRRYLTRKKTIQVAKRLAQGSHRGWFRMARYPMLDEAIDDPSDWRVWFNRLGHQHGRPGKRYGGHRRCQWATTASYRRWEGTDAFEALAEFDADRTMYVEHVQ